MEKYFDLFSSFSLNETLLKLIITIGLLYLFSLIKRQISRFINEKVETSTIAYRLNHTKNIVLNVIFLIIFVQIWFSFFQSISTFLGLLTAGLAIALKDIISDVAGYVYITAKRPFIEGDRIQIGAIQGDVLEISFLHFTLLEVGNWVEADQSTGRVVHIPSATILNDSLFNYNKGFNWIWNEIHILLTYNSDWKHAKKVILELANDLLDEDLQIIKKDMLRAKKNMLITYSNISPILYTEGKDSGINLTLRYLCNPKNRRGSASRIWESLIDLVEKEETIELAFPTQTIEILKP